MAPAQGHRRQFDFSKIKSIVMIENINDTYILGRQIGQGTYGRVREATHIESGL